MTRTVILFLVVAALFCPLHAQTSKPSGKTPWSRVARVAAETKSAPTFAEQIAPIVHKHCADCHSKDRGAPFELVTYKDVRKRGAMIARVTRKRYMPPWHPVKGHGNFVGAMRLSDVEIQTIDQWVKGGMPEGDAKKTPAPPKFKSGWHLGKPDVVVRMKEGFEVPAGGPDIYRSFVIPLDLKEDKWLTAVEVRASKGNVLHHVLFGFDTRGRARRMDGEDGKPGFPSMQGGGSNGRTSTSALGGWAVGGQARHLPLGLARKIPAGADLVLDSHFHPSGKKEIEKTILGLYFTDKAPERTMTALQMPPSFGVMAGIDIPPGKADFTISDSITLPVAAQAITVGGHAHYVCKEMHIWATPPKGKKQSIFWIDNWAFNWQNRYQYSQPFDLPAGTKVDIAITYDNSAKNPNNPNDPPKRIRWGLQSEDEMGSVTILLVPKVEKDARALRRAIRSYRRNGMRRGDMRGIEGALLSQLKMMDKNGDGKLEASEIPERSRPFLMIADTNGDGVIDQDEINSAAGLLRGGGRQRRRRSRDQ